MNWWKPTASSCRSNTSPDGYFAWRAIASPICFAKRSRRASALPWQDVLPSPDAGPDALYARNLLLDELEMALEELPEEQREVFVAHEFEGRTFKEIGADTGVSVNTLLSRKRYAVLHLRERLRNIYDEFTKT